LTRQQPLERLTTPLTGSALLAAFGAIPSASGQYVSPSTALQIATVYSCVRVVAETIATLPLHVYRELPRGGSERVYDHSGAVRFGRKGPNREMSRVDYLEALAGHVLLWGNGYSSVERSVVDGSITSLTLLRPDQTTLTRNSRNVLVYQTIDELGQLTLRRYDRVLHVRILSRDGLTGY